MNDDARRRQGKVAGGRGRGQQRGQGFPAGFRILESLQNRRRRNARRGRKLWKSQVQGPSLCIRNVFVGPASWPDNAVTPES